MANAKTNNDWTEAALAAMGWQFRRVETVGPGGQRHDLFGFGDYMAHDRGEWFLIQVTAAGRDGHVNKHLKKMREKCQAGVAFWMLDERHRIEIWAWTDGGVLERHRYETVVTR